MRDAAIAATAQNSTNFTSPTYEHLLAGSRRSAARGVETGAVVSLLLSVTFACGVVIALSHVVNRGFIAPAYDVVLNLAAFGCAVAASLLLGHDVPALLSAVAILCWVLLARRTILARRGGVDTAHVGCCRSANARPRSASAGSTRRSQSARPSRGGPPS